MTGIKLYFKNWELIPEGRSKVKNSAVMLWEKAGVISQIIIWGYFTLRRLLRCKHRFFGPLDRLEYFPGEIDPIALLPGYFLENPCFEKLINTLLRGIKFDFQ